MNAENDQTPRAEGPHGAAPAKAVARKKGAPVELPNGCSLSREVEIPVSDLVITERRDEGERGEANLRNLGRSMMIVGQLYPLLVRFDQGKYSVLAGNRRLAAALLEGILALRCRIFEGPDKALPFVISAIENAHREQEAPWTLAQKLRAAVKAGYQQQELAEMFGKSKGAVSELLYAATKLPAPYRKRIERGENLFKVVAEHKKSRTARNDPRPPGTEESARATPEGVPPSAAPEATEVPGPPTAPPTPDSRPVARVSYGRFEHGGLTITVSGTSKEKPAKADLMAAFGHALSLLESSGSGEEG